MGHTGCGGIQAAYKKDSLGGMLDLWVTNIRRIMHHHKKHLAELPTEEKKLAFMVK
jgi:carbonic anhydrase